MSYYRDKEMLKKLRIYFESKLNLINSLDKHLENKGNLSAKQLDLVKKIHSTIKDEKI